MGCRRQRGIRSPGSGLEFHSPLVPGRTGPCSGHTERCSHGEGGAVLPGSKDLISKEKRTAHLLVAQPPCPPPPARRAQAQPPSRQHPHRPAASTPRASPQLCTWRHSQAAGDMSKVRPTNPGRTELECHCRQGRGCGEGQSGAVAEGDQEGLLWTGARGGPSEEVTSEPDLPSLSSK